MLPPPAAPIVPLNGKELYDSIMSKIEPDLVSSQVVLLPQKYNNEPADLKRERLARYTAAFKKYDETYQTYLGHLRAQIKQYKTDAFAWAEEMSASAETEQMGQLSTQFATSSK